MSGAAGSVVALRAMRGDDLDQVEAIEAASFVKPWSRDAFAHELALPFSVGLVAHPADDPGVVAGYVVCWTVADEVHLLDLAVGQGFRRRGVGGLLTRAVLDLSVREAARLVTLEVAEENVAGRALYAASGFVPVLVRRDYYAPGAHAVVMEWSSRAALQSP